MLNNPNTLIYVDKEDFSSMSGVKTPAPAKKPNIFKLFIQLFKDNKEYENYRKTTLINELKYHKAVEKIKLSKEQLDDAKALQMNVFKTFNKVDEKSQTYSENIEAVGEIVKQGVMTFGSLIAIVFSSLSMSKMLEDKNINDKNLIENLPKIILKAFTPLVLVLLPIILIDVYTTKAQKKASRVADMLALKELEDYRNYANYKDNSQITKNSETKSIQENQSTNLLKHFKS